MAWYDFLGYTAQPPLRPNDPEIEGKGRVYGDMVKAALTPGISALNGQYGLGTINPFRTDQVPEGGAYRRMNAPPLLPNNPETEGQGRELMRALATPGLSPLFQKYNPSADQVSADNAGAVPMRALPVDPNNYSNDSGMRPLPLDPTNPSSDQGMAPVDLSGPAASPMGPQGLSLRGIIPSWMGPLGPHGAPAPPEAPRVSHEMMQRALASAPQMLGDNLGAPKPEPTGTITVWDAQTQSPVEVPEGWGLGGAGTLEQNTARAQRVLLGQGKDPHAQYTIGPDGVPRYDNADANGDVHIPASDFKEASPAQTAAFAARNADMLGPPSQGMVPGFPMAAGVTPEEIAIRTQRGDQRGNVVMRGGGNAQPRGETQEEIMARYADPTKWTGGTAEQNFQAWQRAMHTINEGKAANAELEKAKAGVESAKGMSAYHQMQADVMNEKNSPDAKLERALRTEAYYAAHPESQTEASKALVQRRMEDAGFPKPPPPQTEIDRTRGAAASSGLEKALSETWSERFDRANQFMTGGMVGNPQARAELMLGRAQDAVQSLLGGRSIAELSQDEVDKMHERLKPFLESEAGREAFLRTQQSTNSLLAQLMARSATPKQAVPAQ